MTTKPLEQFGTSMFDAESGALIVRFDGNFEEKHARTADVTELPIENGLPITDNHAAYSRSCDLVGVVSNTPLFQEQNITNRAQFYYDVLDQLCREGTRLTITTGLGVYSNAVIKDYVVPRDYQNAQSLEITLKIKEIVIVTSATVEVPANILSAARRASGKSSGSGTTSPKDETEEQAAARNRSILDTLFND